MNKDWIFLRSTRWLSQAILLLLVLAPAMIETQNWGNTGREPITEDQLLIEKSCGIAAINAEKHRAEYQKKLDVIKEIRSMTLETCIRLRSGRRCSPDDIQAAVRHLLETKYNDFGNQWEVLIFKFGMNHKVSSAFYSVPIQELGIVIVAFAIGQDPPTLPASVVQRLELFYPRKAATCNAFYLNSAAQSMNYDANQIYDDLKSFLVGVSAVKGTHLEIGVFVDVKRSCDSENDRKPFRQIGGKLIRGSKWKNKTITPSEMESSDNLDYWLGSGHDCGCKNSTMSNCFDVIVFPVSADRAQVRLAASSEDEMCVNNVDSEEHHPVRLGNDDLYLSVINDSDQDGSFIVLRCEWNNTKGQLWRFVDGQLMNGHGLCLTAWNYQGNANSNLFQHKCSSRLDGQKWRRHGLQIINDLGPDWPFYQVPYFLSGNSWPNSYVFRDHCGTQGSWTFWHKCEELADEEYYRQLTEENGIVGRPIRNQKTNKYLSYDRTLGALSVRSWNDEDGQKWIFVNGQLQNICGRCLAASYYLAHYYARVEDCCGANWQKWILENSTISTVSGECLGVQHFGLGFQNCKSVADDDAYRWVF